MTESKAISMMRDYSRSIVEYSFASKLASAFGKSLSGDLGLKKAKRYRLSNSGLPISNEKPGIAISELSKALAISLYPNLTVTTSMHGAGSGADDIVEKSTIILEASLKGKEIEFEFLSKTDLSFFAKKRVKPQEAEDFSIKHQLTYKPLTRKL